MATPASPTQVTWRFAVQGMHCDGCADGIRSELLRVEGVQVAKVSFKEGTALVTAEPRQVTVARVMQVIDEAGYTATRIAP